jgi:hypothetical protein
MMSVRLPNGSPGGMHDPDWPGFGDDKRELKCACVGAALLRHHPKAKSNPSRLNV